MILSLAFLWRLAQNRVAWTPNVSNRVLVFKWALSVSADEALFNLRIYYSEITYCVKLNILLADNIFRCYASGHAEGENYYLGLPVRTV